jgi:hypothetical protein
LHTSNQSPEAFQEGMLSVMQLDKYTKI